MVTQSRIETPREKVLAGPKAVQPLLVVPRASMRVIRRPNALNSHTLGIARDVKEPTWKIKREIVNKTGEKLFELTLSSAGVLVHGSKAVKVVSRQLSTFEVAMER